MNYKTDEDQFANGFDAGQIQDGTVVLDESTGELVILGDDGLAFSLQRALARCVGKRVRVTCVSMEVMESLQKMLDRASKS